MFTVVSWNVNSITMRLDRTLALLQRLSPEVVCLQELKCTDEKFPYEAFMSVGYFAVIHGQKTYNGVAILPRSEPTDVLRGFGDDVDDPAARFISASIQGVRVCSV